MPLINLNSSVETKMFTILEKIIKSLEIMIQLKNKKLTSMKFQTYIFYATRN